MNVSDMGECVRAIFLRPNEFKAKIVEAAGDYLRGVEIAEALNNNFPNKKFIYGNVSLDKFKSFGFPGAEEFSNMFEYFQSGKMKRDIVLTKKLNPNTLKFNDWIIKNKQDIEKMLANAH